MPASLRCDERRLGDEQCAIDTSSLSVVVDSELIVDMILPRTKTGERREHNSMLKGEITDSERGEELGCRHFLASERLGRAIDVVESCACSWPRIYTSMSRVE